MAVCENQLPAKIAEGHHVSHDGRISLDVCGRLEMNHNQCFATAEVQSNQMYYVLSQKFSIKRQRWVYRMGSSFTLMILSLFMFSYTATGIFHIVMI